MGVKKAVVETTISFDNYEDCFLFFFRKKNKCEE